jgi:hypothetical protein
MTAIVAYNLNESYIFIIIFKILIVLLSNKQKFVKNDVCPKSDGLK